ncbi:MAG: stage II sporulation protein M [Candidatus Eremiobacteraeota bacterium]|nr:stage II sporulation protein M [Candidatus Eremiobacteraeota bacterium]
MRAMRERRFVKARRGRWDRLSVLVDRASGRGVRALTADEIDELALAYRAATSDLAIARTRGEDALVLDHLNRLTARAHAVVYVATARNGWHRVVDFVMRGFPREVRRSWAPIVFCALVTIVSALIAYGSVSADPANAHALLPDMDLAPPTKALHDSNFGFDRAYSPAAASEIITNNVKVAAIAFAGGITGGVLTGWIILENGLMVGALGALYAKAGFGPDFWATIAPHGVIELTAIQIAGGAGLIVAGGFLRPGRARRTDALVAAARRAATLVLGVALMLCVAGTIEGFISPQRLPIPARAAIGALTAVALIAYLIGAGSKKSTGLDVDVRVEQRDGQLGGRDVDDQNPAIA